MCSGYILTSWLGLVVFVGALFYLVCVEKIEVGLVRIFLIGLLGLLSALALFNLFVLYRIKGQLKRKKFPLLKAIYAKKSNAVVWIYQLNTTYIEKNEYGAQTYSRRKK
jgi:hypothetical protein